MISWGREAFFLIRGSIFDVDVDGGVEGVEGGEGVEVLKMCWCWLRRWGDGEMDRVLCTLFYTLHSMLHSHFILTSLYTSLYTSLTLTHTHTHTLSLSPSINIHQHQHQHHMPPTPTQTSNPNPKHENHPTSPLPHPLPLPYRIVHASIALSHSPLNETPARPFQLRNQHLSQFSPAKRYCAVLCLSSYLHMILYYTILCSALLCL
jgi:hypothetical protein